MLYAPEQVSHAAFVERVQARMIALNLSLPTLSLRSGLKEAQLKNILYKATEPNRSAVVNLAQALQTTVEFLTTGAHAIKDDDSVSLTVQTPEALAISLDLISDATNGSASVDARITSLPMPKRVISLYAVKPENVRAISINTEALNPTLTQQDIALIDIGTTRLTEGIFLLAIRDSVVLRWASPVSSGFALTATSAHIYGAVLEIDPDTGKYLDPAVKVIGKVFCAINMRNL